MSKRTDSLLSALISIHDLMPETMDRVERILNWLTKYKVPPVSLLVVPGKPWNAVQIDKLKSLSASGHELIAHGWRHETVPKKIYHRIHSAFISQNVAEHLNLRSNEIKRLMQRSHDWFEENGLSAPVSYIPPAWALGPIYSEDLHQTPYALIETTSCIRLLKQSTSGEIVIKLPLTGFEADTMIRANFLKTWNNLQTKKAKHSGLPLRISIHPNDLNLKLFNQLERIVKSCNSFLSYKSLINQQSQ